MPADGDTGGGQMRAGVSSCAEAEGCRRRASGAGGAQKAEGLAHLLGTLSAFKALARDRLNEGALQPRWAYEAHNCLILWLHAYEVIKMLMRVIWS